MTDTGDKNKDTPEINDFNIVNIGENEGAEILLKMTNEGIELDFFKVLFLSIVMSQSKFFIDKLMEIDPCDLY